MKTLLSLIFIPFLCLSAYGQSDPELEAQIQAVRNATFRAGETFLNSSLPTEARVNAIRQFSGLYDENQIAAAKSIVQNTTEAPAVRGMALEKLVDQITSDEALWNTTLAWLVDASAPAEQRHAALTIMRSLSFSPYSMFDKNQEVMADLRSVATDQDPEIRTFALNYLSAQGDNYAQGLLSRELQNRRPDLVPLADAVGILALNAHGDYLPLINQIFQNPPDQESEFQALSVLGGYRPARNKINQVLRDKRRPAIFRQIALSNLLQNYPAQSDDLSFSILNDNSESDVLKGQAIGFTYFKRKSNREKNIRNRADRLDIAIRGVFQRTNNRNLQQLISWYLDEVNPVY